MNNTSPLKVRPAGELLEAEGQTQRFILEPILASDTAGLIYGAPGVGKSFLALGLALAAAGGGSFLGWTSPRPRKVLYLDGEMSRKAVSCRLRLFGPPPPSLHLWLSSDETGTKLDLSSLDDLLRLADIARDMDLVIIDSLPSLTATTHRDPQRWLEFRHYLAVQQRHRRAIVMVHHASRDGALHGISERAFAVDLVMAVRRPRDWQPADGARFEVRLEKTRHQTGAEDGRLEAQLHTDADGRGHWQWSRGGSAALRRAAPLLRQGMSAEAVAKAIGVSPRTAYRLQSRARELGWVRRTPDQESLLGARHSDGAS